MHQLEQPRAGGHVSRVRHADTGGELGNPQKLLFGGIRHRQLEEEAVQLRLGQRVGSFHLDRILGGEDEEWLRQGMCRAAGGHATFLHRLQQRRLRFGRGAIDLVREHQIGEQRTWLEFERAGAVAGVAQDARAGDIGGHQVRRELNATERQVERLADGPYQQGFAQAGNALEQRVPTCQQAG